jgi:hypothetical protein
VSNVTDSAPLQVAVDYYSGRKRMPRSHERFVRDSGAPRRFRNKPPPQAVAGLGAMSVLAKMRAGTFYGLGGLDYADAGADDVDLMGGGSANAPATATSSAPTNRVPWWAWALAGASVLALVAPGLSEISKGRRRRKATHGKRINDVF